MKNIIIRNETEKDYRAVEELTREAVELVKEIRSKQ